MKKTIKAYYIDPITNTAEAREITPDLDTYYNMLHCSCIDIVNRGFYGRRKRFEIICDDEGTFVDDPRISAIDVLGKPMLVGSLLVVGQADGNGELTSLTSDDIRLLKRQTSHLGTRKHPDGWMMLTSLTY